MKRFCPIVKSSLLMIVCTILFYTANAAVTVTPAPSGTCLNVSPGAYKAIGDIVIQEGNNGDFSAGAAQTLILTAPTNFQFQAGTGSVSYQGGRNFTSAAITVTASTITITYNIGGTNRSDRLTISGIVARATASSSSGNILRVAPGGSGTIAGDATGGAVNHGTLTSGGGTFTTIAAGNWTAGGTWSGGVAPSCGANVVINHTVTGNTTTSVNNLTINTGGTLTSNNPLTVGGTFTINGTGTYVHNNTGDASTTIFAGTESFSTTSTLRILNWYDTNIPLATNVTGNFGHIIFDEGNLWDQDGLFSPHRIKGNLTIESGGIVMDDGTGMTTSLTLQDVTMNGDGCLRIAEGTNRNLTLVTNNYTDNGNSSGIFYSGIQFNCAGTVNWTVNGNVSIDADWSFFEGAGSTAGNSTIVINGDFNITNGLVDINRKVDAPLNLTINGDLNISGGTDWVRFIDRNDEDLTVVVDNVYMSACNAITFYGGVSPTGDVNFTVNNDLTLSGSSTIANIVSSTANVATAAITIGRDLIVTDGDFRLVSSNAPTTLDVGRNLVVNGVNGDFYGQVNGSSTKLIDIDISGTLQVNSGDFYASQGQGQMNLDVVETVDINNGRLYGIYHLTATNNGAPTLTCTDIDFDGGTFILLSSVINDGKTATLNVNNNIDITFLNATDVFAITNIAGSNNALADVNVTGNVSISGGVAGSYFLSSASSGSETIDIGGSLNVSAGDVYFVGDKNTLKASHNIVTNILGDVNISGGNTRFAAGGGTADINISGSVAISNGVLTLKDSTGSATMDVIGSFTQTGGTYNIHVSNYDTPNSCTVTIYSDFSMANGTFNFDSRQIGAGLAEHSLYLYGDNFTLGGSATITHANNLTTNFIFGQIYFAKSGTTVYTRNTTTNNIQHVKYTIQAGTTVDASASPEGFQMTSVGSSTAANHNALTVNGTLDMGSKVLIARQSGSHYSRVTVNSGGRYRTSHTGGLYSGSSTVPSSINGYMTTFNRVNYQLDANSIVEYYGTATSTITGIPNGIASTNAQKYGILDINFTGSAGTTWVYPESDNEVFVRTQLILSEGEFNLDDDHVTASGGRSITIEGGATISRTNGFIRSETEDGSGLVNWAISSNGSYTVPFGYDASTYIPFTYQQTSGTTGTLAAGTYRSAADNTPYPPTVTHVRDASGSDNSANTVDRFWYVTVSGSPTASITYTYAASEGTGILAPRAQRWEPVSLGWFPATAAQSNPTATTTLTPSLTNFNTWWTLAAGASPLPIELVYFNAEKAGDVARISWETAAEINNDYFTIERSGDGNTFEAIEYVQGAGNSSSPLSYSRLDKTPLEGRNYYRLKQTDYDGHFTYSDIKTVFFGKKGNFSLYPNPVIAGNAIEVAVPEKGDYQLTLSDAAGRIVNQAKYTAAENQNIVLNSLTNQLSTGMYQLSITSASEHATIKFMIR